MAAWLITPAEFPNRLTDPRPSVAAPRFTWLPWLLLLACLLPRAIAAVRTDTICSDGAAYLRSAQELGQGDLSGYWGLKINVYPVVLMLLHRAGLPLEFGAKLWGVCVSSLVVLPLFGWVRRQFDDRVAAVASLMYAVHPKLVEFSPDVIRDSTFWFLFTASLYFLWRAIAEVQWKLFAAAGLAVALSVLTRFEGLCLFLPLTIWSVIRWRALRMARWRLVAGTVLALVCLPALLVAMSLLWLHGAAPGRLLRMDPWQRVEKWVASWTPNESCTTPADGNSQSPNDLRLPAPPTTRKLLWSFVFTMERGITPLFGLLMFGGYLAWRKQFNRSDDLPLALITLAICAGIWIHLWFGQVASSRYVLPIVIMATRCAALGLISFTGWVVQHAQNCMASSKVVRWVSVPPSVFAVVVTASLADAFTGYEDRHGMRSWGEWIRQEYGENRMIISSYAQTPLIGYYAHGNAIPVPGGLSGDRLLYFLADCRPDVVIISQRSAAFSAFRALSEEYGKVGLQQVDRSQLPDHAANAVVLHRTSAALRVTRLPGHEAGR